MMHSKWRADRGGYDVFESGSTVPLGNDMPTPNIRATHPIGVSSVTIGRPLPAHSRRVGVSDYPVGTVTATRSAMSLSGIGDSLSSPWAWLIAGLLAGWGITTWSRK